ncbi:MAG: hypothetical protein AAFY26_16430 [Cyanobacteria bacterium J06638_22]
MTKIQSGLEGDRLPCNSAKLLQTSVQPCVNVDCCCPINQMTQVKKIPFVASPSGALPQYPIVMSRGLVNEQRIPNH